MNIEKFCFNELLKITLKALNLRYKDLLDLMKVEYYLDQSIVSKWVRGTSKPTQKHYNDIVNALYIKVHEFNGKGYTILLDKLMFEIIEYIKQSSLPDDTKNNLIDIQEVDLLLKSALELSYHLDNDSNFNYASFKKALADNTSDITEESNTDLNIQDMPKIVEENKVEKENAIHRPHNFNLNISSIIKKNKMIYLSITCLIIILSSVFFYLFYFTDKTAKEFFVDAESVLTFKSLPCGLIGGENGNFVFDESTQKFKEDNARTVQNFYLSDNEIYVTQCFNNDTYLSRCEITGSGSSKVAICRDYIILEDCGIGESLEVNIVGNSTYIWVGSSGNPANSYHSTELKRIEYVKTNNKANTPKLASVKSTRTLKSMDLATVDKTSLGVVERVACAIEDGNSRIGFRIQLTNGFVYYSIYDLAKINSYIENNETVIMSDLTFACLSSFQCIEKPNGSFQGYDMLDADNKKEFHYLIGGNPGMQPKISKISTNKNVKNGVYELESKTTINNFVLSPQGVKILGDDLYFVLNPGVDEAYSTVLYKIKKP